MKRSSLCAIGLALALRGRLVRRGRRNGPAAALRGAGHGDGCRTGSSWPGIPDGDFVSEAEWTAFLAEVVARFPEGLTVSRAEGQWLAEFIHPPSGSNVRDRGSDLGEFLAATMEMDVLIFLAVAIGGHLDLHPAGFALEQFAPLGGRNPYVGTGLRHLLGDGIDAHGWPLSGEGNA